METTYAPKYVPAALAAVALARAGKEHNRVLPAAAITIGNRVEINLEACPPSTQKILIKYAERAENYNINKKNLDVDIQVETKLYSTYAKTNGDNEELKLTLETLENWAAVAHVCSIITGPDKTKAIKLAEQAGWKIEKDEGNAVTYSFQSYPTGWPTLFGGPAYMNEKTRILNITVNYAKWRDRKLRRLLNVTVNSLSYWPQP